MTSETHRSVSDVIRDLDVQFATKHAVNTRALHCFDDELTALRSAEKNLLAQIQRLEAEKNAYLQRNTMEDIDFTEVSRTAIFEVLDGQKNQLEMRSRRYTAWWNDAVHACIDNALKESELGAVWHQIRHVDSTTPPSLGTVGASSQSIVTTHQANELATLRHALYARIHQLAYESTLPPLQLDLVLSIESMSEEEFSVTFVLPVSGLCLEEENAETVSACLVYRILEGMYTYLRQTPKETGHVHVGVHDGLTILELDLMSKDHIDEVTAALSQCVRHHVCRSSELISAGIRPRVTVIDANLLFPATDASELEIHHVR